MKILISLLSLGFLIMGCAPKKPCITQTVGPLSVESPPPLVSRVEDPLQDFILDHPLFERNFDVVYGSNEVIPQALDIIAVEVALDGDYYRFHIRTAKEGLPELLEEGRHSARFGVYVDKDLNGASDILLTTTDQPKRGLVITPDFKVIEEMPRLIIGNNSVTMYISRRIVGDHFDWLVVSGYSPVKRAYHPTPLEHVFFVPEIDVVFPVEVPRMFEILTTYSGTGPACQVITTQFNTCPPAGNPPQVSVPGTSYKGVMISHAQCGIRGYALWCVNPPPGFFGKRVFEGAQQGWVARCPFLCGYNNQNIWDTNNDQVPDIVFHTIKDNPKCGTQTNFDQDNDGKIDIMQHEYTYQTNQVVSCNIERDFQNQAILDKRCCLARPPYADPAMVPGSIPPCP